VSRNPNEPPHSDVVEEVPIAQRGGLYPQISIEFDVRFVDLWRFAALHQMRSIAVHMFYGAAALFIGWSTAHSDSCIQRGNCVSVGMIAAVLAYVTMTGTQLLFNAMFLFARNNQSAFTRHQVALTHEGLTEETRYKRSLFLWPGIRKAISGMGIVVVYITAHAAIIVPKRHFASAQQRELFIRTINANLQRT
jgi:hypothetical protein